MEAKLGTELNVALDTDEDLREESLSLNVGYDRELRSWNLIVRYTGELDAIANDYSSIATELLGGFGVMQVPEDRVIALSLDTRIIYIEKPKEFIQERASIEGFAQSCMSVPYFDIGLRGQGITVAVIDSGIDIFHEDFKNYIDGVAVTKLAGLWDQSLQGNPPAGYNIGTFFNREALTEALQESSFPSRDISGHGTAVAGIVTACTPEATLLIIKLDTGGRDETDTINLMLGIDFAVRYSIDNNIPMVINLSYGNNSGDHRGNSVLEQYVETVSGMSRTTFVVGSGNDGAAARHSRVSLNSNQRKYVEFMVPFGEGGINIELWKSYQDEISITLIAPNQAAFGPYSSGNGLAIYRTETMNIRLLGLGPTAINPDDEIFVSIIPLSENIQEGVWTIQLVSGQVSSGVVDIWLPVQGATTTELGFLNPSDLVTLTVPSTTDSVITVGAYDSISMTFAGFSGRGFTASGAVKPDLLAPGVDIDTAMVGGGYTRVTGTSFATPFVSSAAAMLMEYGIVRGNDSFLYGQKVKSYLIAGARAFVGYENVPNPFTGWGSLCVEDSFPFEV